MCACVMCVCVRDVCVRACVCVHTCVYFITNSSTHADFTIFEMWQVGVMTEPPGMS